jgi:hypothetical protein
MVSEYVLSTMVPDYAILAVAAIPLVALVIWVLAGDGMSYGGRLVSMGTGLGGRAEGQKREKEEELRVFYHSLESEVSSWWSGYMAGPGKVLEALGEDKAWLAVVPAKEMVFPVDAWRMERRGQGVDGEVSKALATTYVTWESLQQMIEGYSGEVRAYHRLQWIKGRRGESEDEERLRAKRAELVRMTKGIKAGHRVLERDVAGLLARLKEKSLERV